MCVLAPCSTAFEANECFHLALQHLPSFVHRPFALWSFEFAFVFVFVIYLYMYLYLYLHLTFVQQPLAPLIIWICNCICNFVCIFICICINFFVSVFVFAMLYVFLYLSVFVFAFVATFTIVCTQAICTLDHLYAKWLWSIPYPFSTRRQWGDVGFCWWTWEWT